jgi:drug/metabolite transporter (DMT)-like permease
MTGVTGPQLYGALLGLLGATCAAFATIEVRRLTATEKTGAIVFYFSVMTTVFGLITFFVGLYDQRFAWVMPNVRDGILLVMVGMLGGIGQITLTHSYRHADASMVAPFDYTSMVWAVLVGYAMFGDLPNIYIVVGAVIVIASGIFVILRERALGIERKKQRKAAPSRAV